MLVTSTILAAVAAVSGVAAAGQKCYGQTYPSPSQAPSYPPVPTAYPVPPPVKKTSAIPKPMPTKSAPAPNKFEAADPQCGGKHGKCADNKCCSHYGY
eukprot:jgi/Hompol1/4064/HPOL_006902-RA